MKKTEQNHEYEITFTLKQVGLDGDIQAFLDYSHPPGGFDSDDLVPESYARMLHLVQYYLEKTEFVDKDGNIIYGEDNDEYFYAGASETRRLN